MTELLDHDDSGDRNEATVRLVPEVRGDQPVSPELYGKFAEHLAWNVDHGMSAQIVYNPTVGRWRFRAGSPTADGGFVGSQDDDRIAAQITEHADERDYPDAVVDRLVDAVDAGLAFPWMLTDADAVTPSPDTGRARNRAQRFEVETAGEGIVQLCYLPLQRTRSYELSARLRARAGTTAPVTIALSTVTGDGRPGQRLAATEVTVDDEWTVVEDDLSIPVEEAPDDDDLVAVSVTAAEPANVVLDRVTLYPDDHVDRADPDVVAFLRDADLPLLRWPGGNFVSDYDWRDGVGPVDARPTRNNPAWGGVEPNLFGTDEFVQFCRNVGCEPMICVNAGTGTPAEAAAWVSYCNDDPDESEWGALRAEHGHPEPHDVQYWEVGNELYGRWQASWTTPDGYVDRYRRFREAIREADRDVEVLACGNLGAWDEHLVKDLGGDLETVTDHQLRGGLVEDPDAIDRDGLYHALMGEADRLADRYADLETTMADAGIEDPGLAITELQLTPTLATYARESTLSAPWRGSRHHPPDAALPGKKTMAETVWDASIIHDAIRSEGFLDLVTHTGAVNHGGGLQKRKERVWADPCHYGHALGVALAETTPVRVDLSCETVSTAESHLGFDPVDDVPVLDAMAGVDDDGLVVVLAHRGSGVGAVETTVDLGGLDVADACTVTTLAAETMHAENTIENPERVSPETTQRRVGDGAVSVTVPEYGLVRLTVDRS
ncbi:MAG: alpha-L-arabinofuranosidase C-terminal domain-containing protein [Halobacteriaceae archaeon]